MKLNEHRMYCNYYNSPLPCKCCENHPEWPYLSELMETNHGMTAEEVMDKEIKEKFPDAIRR